MLLHEIITTNEQPSFSILTSELFKYRNSLLIYYRNEFSRNNEPVLMVTSVFNACSYAKIVSECELSEAIDEYLNADSTLTEEDKETAKETILFNSIPLYNF